MARFLSENQINKINTFMAYENKIHIGGVDENNTQLNIEFDSYDFLQWIDTEQLKYIKKQLIKKINKI